MPEFDVMVAWINTPIVSAFLLMLGMAALLPALITLGSGVAESVAIVCFGLFFGARFMVAGHHWVPAALFVVGVGLLFVEVALVPGMGKPGILGTLAVGAAVVMSFNDLETGALALLGSGLSATAGTLAMLRFLPRNRLFRKWMVLEPPSGQDVAHASDAESSPWLGRQGLSVTPLRPTGFVEIDGQRVDVVTEGEFVERGRTVWVVKVEGSRVVVRSTAPGSTR